MLRGPGGDRGVGALTLPAEQAQELDRFRLGIAEPVRYAGVELGRLAGCEHQVLVAEYEAQFSVQDVEPFVALVYLRVGFLRAPAGRNDLLVGLDAAGPPGQRQDRPAVAGDRVEVDARGSGWRGA